MDQSQPMAPAPKSNLKWLLIVLAVVIVGGGLYYYFGIVKASPTTTSPTPSKSVFLSSSPNVSPTKTSTPSSNQASAAVSSPSPTATPAAPTGWKYDTWGLTDQTQHDITASYVVLIKDSWGRGGGGGSSLHSAVGYGEQASDSGWCGLTAEDICPFSLTITSGAASGSNQFATLDNKGHVTLSFNGLSDSDQKIIRDSFKVTK